MVQGYTCSACASNLSRVEGKNIYRCTYCGKLYTDDNELIDLKLAESLRKEKKNNLAKDYLEELAVTSPDDHVYKWEILNCSITPNLLSDHIASVAYDPDKLSDLRRSDNYKNFHDDAPEDWKAYVTNIDKYIAVSKMISEKRGRYNERRPVEADGELVDKAVRNHKRLMTLCAVIGVAPFLIGLFTGSGYAFMISILIAAALMAAMYFVVREHNKRYREKRADDTLQKRTALDNAKKAEKDEIDSLRRQARELMESIRAKEQEILDLISR